MDFRTSTHRDRWLLTVERIEQLRAELNTKAVEATRRAQAEDPESPAGPAPEFLSLDEEATLRRYYSEKIKEVCRSPTLQYHPRVQHCAQVLFARFYLGFSVMDHDPQRLFRTCIYFASKVEDSLFDRLDDFCAKAKENPETVRRYEAVVLEGVGYDLVVHTPYRALKGIFLLLSDPPAGLQLDPSLASLDPPGKAKLQQAAFAVIEDMMMSDLPLTYTPGQLASAAFRAACRSRSLDPSSFIHSLAAASAAEPDASAPSTAAAKDPAAAASALTATLDSIDSQLAAHTAAPRPTLEALQALDRRLKRCLNPYLNPASTASKRKAKEQQQEKNERREAKIAKHRQKEADALAAILGEGPGAILQPRVGSLLVGGMVPGVGGDAPSEATGITGVTGGPSGSRGKGGREGTVGTEGVSGTESLTGATGGSEEG